MLRPRDSKTRDAVQITGLWDFCLDPENRGIGEQWFLHGLKDLVRMTTGTSFNDIFTEKSIRDYSGAFWYRKQVKIPFLSAGSRMVLYFESVTHGAQVWVNGTPVCRHAGGYLPFQADITDVVRPGDFAAITVRADNILSFGTIPPGIIVEELSCIFLNVYSCKSYFFLFSIYFYFYISMFTKWHIILRYLICFW